MNILEARKISKTYRNGSKALEVLKGISVDIKKSEIIAVVGPSGAGKSTLLHILGALDRPTEGEISFEDKKIYKISDKERARIRNAKMGFVFQFYHLLADFTAIENVCMPANIMGSRRGDYRMRAEKILGQLGLTSRMSHYPSQLSGGEMRRVAIARALINEPDILFCDEPTGNLDSTTGSQIKDLIWNLNREKGQSVAIVTHDERLVKDADRILHIKDGLIEEGDR